jgi:regulator of sigma E protease
MSSHFAAYVTRSEDNNVDLVLIRNGEKVRLDNYHMVPVEYRQEDGSTVMRYGLLVGAEESGVLAQLKYSWYCALDFVRMVRIGLTDLVTGRASVREMTGVVGIVGIIGETGKTAADTVSALEDIAYLVAFIAINLAVFNLLPLPALDGGRVLGLFLTWAIEKLTRRKLNPKIEGYIHFTGLVLLVGLMVLVMFNDIIRMVGS